MGLATCLGVGNNSGRARPERALLPRDCRHVAMNQNVLVRQRDSGGLVKNRVRVNPDRSAPGGQSGNFRLARGTRFLKQPSRLEPLDHPNQERR
jgi:hypothetical protein